MAGNIKGIIVEIGGDTSNLQKALSKVNSATSSLSKELRGVNSLLKLDPSNTELLAQKQELLSKNIDETSEKLKLLKDVQKQADEAIANGTKISEENYRNLQREIASTQNKLNGLTDELKQFNTQNSNWTKAGKKIQDYGEKVSKVSEKIDEAGDKLSVLSAGAVAGGTVLANTAMSLEDALSKYVSSTNTASNETEKYKQVLESINNAGYGEGYEDIADSMTAVSMQIKDIDSQNLENITEKAIALRDLFGYDVSESVRSVKALMDNFNISADEAFNLIAEGKKQGLDFSNELLDNVNEYSVQFQKLGLSAEDMFNIFKTGSENGAFNLDKIGDAIKEFSIRAIDGSNTTIDGFKRIGLNADEMAEKFAEGGETAKEAFIEVVKRLGSMDDKVSQSIAGVDLFGTMWEDLGPTVVTSFAEMDSGISQSSDSMQKSIDELYDTTKKKAEKQLKRLQSLGADFGEEMLPVLEDLIDSAEDFIDKLDGMSDAEKENIVKIGLMVAGIGPFTKVLGTAGKTIGTVTKGVGTFSEAIGVAAGKATSSSSSVNNLAKVISGLTSPAGIAITIIGALAAVIGTTLYQANQRTSESFEAMINTMLDYENGINEAEGYLEKFNNTLFSSTEKQSELEDEMKSIQEGITKISKTASDERRDYTQAEIDQLNEYFQKMSDLQSEMMKLQESQGDTLVQTAEADNKSFAGSFEEYKVTSQNWIKTAQDHYNQQKELAEQYKLDSITNLNTMYDEKERIDNEEYNKELERINNEYNTRITSAAEQTKKITEIFSQGMTDRIKNEENMWPLLQKVKDKTDEIERKHAENISNIKKWTLEDSALQNSLLQGAEMAHEQSLKNIYNQMDENLTDSQQDQLATWIQSLADVELYGGKIDDENKDIAQAIITTWQGMPDDAKEKMTDTMQGMLDGMEEKESSLFAKASSIADSVIGTISKVFQIGSPSKVMRKIFRWVVEGGEIGIDDEANTLYKEIDNISDKVLSKLKNISLTSAKFGKLNTSVIESNKTIFTTPQIVFNVQELDEAKLQQCFNYVNKKFGSQY